MTAPAVPPDAPDLRARAAKLIASELRYQLGYTPAGADVVADHLVPALGEAGLLARSDPRARDAAFRAGEKALVKAKGFEDFTAFGSERDAVHVIVTAALDAYERSRAGLLARSEGEAVEALRRQCADDVGQALTRAGIAEDQRDRLRGELKEAVGLLRELLDGYGCQPGYISRLGTQRIEAFLSRSDSRLGPDAPSYGELAEALARLYGAETGYEAAHEKADAMRFWTPEPGQTGPTLVAFLDAKYERVAAREQARALLARLPGAQEPETT